MKDREGLPVNWTWIYQEAILITWRVSGATF